jgi:hypothetical protein
MKKLIITDKEKENILQQHSKINEQKFLWDAGNLKALDKQARMGDVKDYYMEIPEPAFIKTNDDVFFSKLKLALMKYDIPFKILEKEEGQNMEDVYTEKMKSKKRYQ